MTEREKVRERMRKRKQEEIRGMEGVGKGGSMREERKKEKK